MTGKLMVDERVQRRIDRLIDEAEEAADKEDWEMVSERAMDVFALNQDNSDAQILLTAAERGIAETDSPGLVMSHEV